MTRELAFVDSWFGLLEDQLSALWVDAMNPLLDQMLASCVVSALFDPPAGVRLHPVLLTGPGRPDIALIDDDQRVHAVIENKAGAAVNVRDGDGRTQLEAYADDDPAKWLKGLSRAEHVKLIFLTSGKVPADVPGDWSTVTYKQVRDTVDTQLSGADNGTTSSRDGRTFWERFRRELNLAIGVPRSLTVAEVIEGCAFAALPFPTSSQAATVRSTQGYFAYKDDDRKLVNGVAFTEPGWRYDWETGFWVVHHLIGQGDSWAGFNIWFGVPGVPYRKGSRMVVGRAEPPGPLGRLYVSVTGERAAGKHAELHAWLKTEIQNGAGLSVLLREVEYPPHERSLGSGSHALGFWAFDPLAAMSQEVDPADRYAATLKLLISRLVEELSPPQL